MAKITNKSSLNIGTELTVNVATRIITLNVAGNLVAKDGCTWQALYSKMIALWQTASYNEHPFPFYTIDALSGQFNIGFDGTRYNDWTFEANTKLYLRDGGWNAYTPTTPGADGTSATGTIAGTNVGIVSLGTVSTGAQLYYQKVSAGSATNFTYTDAANIGVDVTADTTYFKGYCREYAKKYSESVLADTGKTATGAYLVNLLLSNSDDLDIVNTDTDVIDTPISPYSKMRISYFATNYTKAVESGTGRNFGIVVDVGTHSGVDGSATSAGSVLTSAIGGIDISGNPFAGGTLTIHEGTNKGIYNISGNPTATTVTITGTFPATEATASFTIQRAVPIVASLKQIYTFVQAKLRQAATINNVSGGTSVIGKTASLLMNWTAKLVCGFYAPTNPAGGGSGVIVEGLADADVNSIIFYDNTAATREYPYAAAGTLNFNSNLTSGGTGYYVLYYTDLSAGNDYGTANAVIVKNKLGVDIAGTISSASIAFNYDYTNDTAGVLRTGGTETAVTLIAGNPGVAKPVVATGTLIESKAISISAVAEQDRAYQ
jgi:hypothetical protein